MRAGRPSSDRLFIRLARDQRDIAVYFLVDMSNSTSGWVGQAIKEALVLICEAMEPLNDRYGIYGFSGMRRLRCEVYPVKRLDERYSPQVRQRIGAMGPREYTRMAPAIRHMTSVFADVEAKIRLLIVLSDGKPEDYDEYKGEYAIEDTRHALLEAKARGVHPFCITIDRTAHEYMAHMYGAVNYIFVDEISRLPARMPEIYRTLTT
nr:VWA domain-containing protein [Desulfobulbus alkaliphilus]